MSNKIEIGKEILCDSIFKKGYRRSSNNYRTISVMPSNVRVCTGVIKDVIKQHMDNYVWSYLDNIFIMTQVTERKSKTLKHIKNSRRRRAVVSNDGKWRISMELETVIRPWSKCISYKTVIRVPEWGGNGNLIGLKVCCVKHVYGITVVREDSKKIYGLVD